MLIIAKPILLACTALLAIAAGQSQASAAGTERALEQPIVVAQLFAQAPDPAQAADQAARDRQERKANRKKMRAKADEAKAQAEPDKSRSATTSKDAARKARQEERNARKTQANDAKAAKEARKAKVEEAREARKAKAQEAREARKAKAEEAKEARKAKAQEARDARKAKSQGARDARAKEAAEANRSKARTDARKDRKNAPATLKQADDSEPATRGRRNGNRDATPKVRDSSEFIRRDNKRAGRRIDDLRRERRETRDGNRVVIREGNRTIVRRDNRTIIHHNESSRFGIGARNVRVERRGGHTVTIVERRNGVRIISTTDRDGRLIKRVRRGRNGHEMVLIDNRFAGARAGLFINLAPPVIRIPRERYIVDAERADPVLIFDAFTAPPVERIERRYTLDQVRFNSPLRERMPRVDLDINFDTGSWELTPDQVARLAEVARALNRALEKNPNEVFLVEGHTDPVGDKEDNLSLSDRRAEAVAVALTEEFQVPAENLVTQGYGEEYLKVPTEGPNRENRRVAVRRVTPLIEQASNR